MLHKADEICSQILSEFRSHAFILIIVMESVILHLYVAIPNKYHCTKHITKILVRNTKNIPCAIISYEERRKNFR